MSWRERLRATARRKLERRGWAAAKRVHTPDGAEERVQLTGWPATVALAVALVGVWPPALTLALLAAYFGPYLGGSVPGWAVACVLAGLTFGVVSSARRWGP